VNDADESEEWQRLEEEVAERTRDLQIKHRGRARVGIYA
jgi:hypothetical protein